MSKPSSIQRLIVLLGDQLSPTNPILKKVDPKKDLLWMAEVWEESTHVLSSKPRVAFFLSAMRHFAQSLRDRKMPLLYHRIDEASESGSLGKALASDIQRLHPTQVVCLEPGEWRVKEAMEATCRKLGVALNWVEDPHFLTNRAFFETWASQRKEWRLEYFYREVRKTQKILIDSAGKPEGGKWNYDASNRGSFGKKGPQNLEEPARFIPDAITEEVLQWVEGQCTDHPGSVEHFRWPVTREEALRALEDFINHRLRDFGTYQDAMWIHEPTLYHSRLSAAMNVKLLDPREVIQAVIRAYDQGAVSIEATEGFIRQIAGWREFVRHVYWQSMPGYLESNFLKAGQGLPDFYWDGNTPLSCLHHCVSETLHDGYAHHIQRLMVLGLYSLMLGVDPKQIHAWFLGVYVDAVEWVEAPNVLGMSQFADGGKMSSKPYIATGKYIKRMSNYCQTCPRDPDQATGEKACPFTTLYWDFLMQHEKRLRSNQRLQFQFKNLDRLDDSRRKAIREQAKKVRRNPGCQDGDSVKSQKELFGN